MPWNRGIILCCSARPSCSMCQSPPPGKDSRGDMIQIKVWWRKWKWESFSKRGEHNRKGRRPTYGGWDCVNFHGPKIVVWEYRGEEQKEGICWTIWSHLEGMKHRRSNPKKRVEGEEPKDWNSDGKRPKQRYGLKEKKITIASAQSLLPSKSQKENQHCGVIDLAISWYKICLDYVLLNESVLFCF